MRRRYRDFEWLKKELERDSKVSIIVHYRGMVGSGEGKLNAIASEGSGVK